MARQVIEKKKHFPLSQREEWCFTDWKYALWIGRKGLDENPEKKPTFLRQCDTCSKVYAWNEYRQHKAWEKKV